MSKPHKPVYGGSVHYKQPPKEQRVDTTKEWPIDKKYHPDHCCNYAYNEMTFKNTTPKELFDLVAQPELWPSYYPHASSVSFKDPNADKYMKVGTKFKWTTFDLDFSVEVMECVPYKRIRWEGAAKNPLLKPFGLGTHFWTFIDLGNGDTKIVTEESQTGSLPTVANRLTPHQVADCHQEWLVGLKNRLGKETVEQVP